MKIPHYYKLTPNYPDIYIDLSALSGTLTVTVACVGKVASGVTDYVYIKDSSASTHHTFTFTETTYTHKSATPDVALTSDRYYFATAMSAVDAYILVLQDTTTNNLTATQQTVTVYEGYYSTTSTTAVTLVGQIGLFPYDSSKYDGTVTFKFAARIKTSDSMYTTYACLMQDNGTLAISSMTEIATISTTSESLVYVESSSVTLTSGRNYQVWLKTSNTMATAEIEGAQIIVTQTGTDITKTVVFIPFTDENSDNIQLATQKKELTSLWSGVTRTCYTFMGHRSGFDYYYYLYNITDSSTISNTTLTMTSGYFGQISSSSFTMVDDSELYTFAGSGTLAWAMMYYVMIIVTKSSGTNTPKDFAVTGVNVSRVMVKSGRKIALQSPKITSSIKRNNTQALTATHPKITGSNKKNNFKSTAIAHINTILATILKTRIAFKTLAGLTKTYQFITRKHFQNLSGSTLVSRSMTRTNSQALSSNSKITGSNKKVSTQLLTTNTHSIIGTIIQQAQKRLAKNNLVTGSNKKQSTKTLTKLTNVSRTMLKEIQKRLLTIPKAIGAILYELHTGIIQKSLTATVNISRVMTKKSYQALTTLTNVIRSISKTNYQTIATTLVNVSRTIVQQTNKVKLTIVNISSSVKHNIGKILTEILNSTGIIRRVNTQALSTSPKVTGYKTSKTYKTFIKITLVTGSVIRTLGRIFVAQVRTITSVSKKTIKLLTATPKIISIFAQAFFADGNKLKALSNAVAEVKRLISKHLTA